MSEIQSESDNKIVDAPNSAKRSLPLSFAILLLIAISSISLDQWSKGLVRQNLSFGEVFAPWPDLIPSFRIVHWGNEGAAFGLFQGGGAFFAILAVVVALLIIFYFPKIDHQHWLIRVAMGLQLGGAMGNFIDRLSIGYVTDWIAVMDFPVFNVADSSITVGAISLILFTWISERKEKESVVQQELSTRE